MPSRGFRKTSPWLPTVGALLIALILGGLILAGVSAQGAATVWPVLARNYWLMAAISVLACLGFGKEVQAAAWADLIRMRVGGPVILAVGADAALIAGILCGPQHDTAPQLQPGVTGFLVASGIVAAGLLGRRLMAGALPAAAMPARPASAAATMVDPGGFIPFDAVVIGGRSEVDDGPIGGSALGSLREPGDVVRQGARNGDGRLTVEPMVEAPMLAPDFPAAPTFAPLFNAQALLVLAAMIVFAVGIGLQSASHGTVTALLGLALVTPVGLGLVRPLVFARIRAIAAVHGWRLNGTAAIDALAEINALVCSRGGVVVRSELEIVAIHPALDVKPAELVAAATTLSQSSHGVWARTLLRYAVARKLRLAPITEWSDEIHAAGLGLWAATQGGQKLIAGPREWLEEQGIRTHFLEAQERESLTPGRKSLWVAQVEPVPFLLGVVVAGERLKPGAAEMCKNAKRANITGALLDRRGMAGSAELAQYLGLRLVEDDALARKALATEWETLHLRPAVAQHRGDPMPEGIVGPRLLLGLRFARDGGTIPGGWTAATEREDPRLIMDLLRLAAVTKRRERFGYLLVYCFSVPGLWLLATGQLSAPIATLGAAVGVLGAIVNAGLVGLVPWTSTEVDDEQ